MDTIRTWSDRGLVPGFSIIRPERQLYVTHLEPSTSFFQQVLMTTAEGKVWLPFLIAYNATRVAKNCDWNQAPGCQSETPQIEGKDPAD